ncbi:MAG: hypothetical protein ABMA15_02615 [Vicinamibacterales bacterium]
MSNALEMFRKQREAVQALHAEVTCVADAIGRVRSDLDALARHEALRSVLAEEQRWLQKTEDAVRQVRAWREQDARRHWPGVATRWLVSAVFALAAAASAGVGYAWAVKPYAQENASLRLRQDVAESLERRMLQMTPAERRQLDSLLKGARLK